MGSLAPFGLSASQRAMAEIIEREFVRAGYPLIVAAAAIVNAYAESGLDPKAVGDSGRSIGLMQLNERGAGRGLTVAQRQDPTTNVRTLIARETKALAKVKKLADEGASLPSVTGAFCSLVERPSDKAAKATYRAGLSYRFFPLGVSGESKKSGTSATPSTNSVARIYENPARRWVAFAGIAGLVLMFGGAFWSTRRTRPTQPAPPPVTT